MNYFGLTKAYWNQQVQRVDKVRQQIAERLKVSIGRVVPDATDLAIGTGRRIGAAVMFLDICGFSSRSSGTAEEQTTQLAALNFFFSEMIKIADDYGGTIEKNTGDGLMAYFEDDSATVNGSHRAVSCALTIFATAENLIDPILLQSNIEPFQFRICIDYGHITIAKVGAQRRFNSIVAVGTTANIASKMLDSAKAGELLIGENVRNEIPSVWRDTFTFLHTFQTGWVYRLTNAAYSYYKYTGRWSTLI